MKRLRSPLGLQLLAGAVLGIALSLIPGFGTRVTKAIESVNLLGLLAILIAVHFTAVIIHECGHLLGGRLAGSRFRMLLVGPIALIRLSHGLRWQWNRLLVNGGMAATFPVAAEGVRRKMLFMVAGGPLASLISGLLAVLFYLDLGMQLPPTVRWFAACYGAYSLILAGFNLLPMRVGRFNTDGARILMLIRDTEAARRWCAVAVLAGSYYNGTRPRDWPSELAQRLLSEPEGTLEFLGASVYLYLWFLDRGEIEEAGAWLGKAVTASQSLPPSIKSGVQRSSAWFEAWHRKNPAGARELLKSVVTALGEEPYAKLQTEATIRYAEGDLEKARGMAREALSRMSDPPRTGYERMDSDYLREIINADCKRQYQAAL
jgi:hypothetical protein